MSAVGAPLEIPLHIMRTFLLFYHYFCESLQDWSQAVEQVHPASKKQSSAGVQQTSIKVIVINITLLVRTTECINPPLMSSGSDYKCLTSRIHLTGLNKDRSHHNKYVNK